MELITLLLTIFVVVSFIGWFVRWLLAVIKRKKLMNPGFINLPFIPVYGIAAVIVYLAFSRSTNMYMTFFGAGLMLTILHYLSSMLFERIFRYKWKDYSKKPLNINGYMSAWEPFLYGGVSMIMVAYGFDLIKMLCGLLPTWVMLIIVGSITALIILDSFVTVIMLIRLSKNLKKMKNISSLLNNNLSDKSDEELAEEYERRALKSTHFRRRLVNAFPNMQSANYEKQFADLKAKIIKIRAKNNETYENRIEDPDARPFAYGLSLTKLFWLFFLGSVAGTFIETIFALVVDGKLEIRTAFVVGPFIPVYGGGAVAITLCLYKLYKTNDLIIYIASAIIGATFEYFCSYFQEMTSGTVSWDYSDQPFNIDGRTSLMYALMWGVLGLAWLRYIYPPISRLIEKIPKNKGRVLTIILVIVISIDGAISIGAIYRKAQRDVGNPPMTIVGEWLDNTFKDDYMEFLYPHMQTTALDKKDK